MKNLKEIVADAARLHSVPIEVVEAIIYQESFSCSDKPQYAWRLEERFWSDRLAARGVNELAGYVPSKDHSSGLPSLYDEKIGRACSYGYMQILGETARSILKFKGQFLTELFDPEININLGCELLAKNLKTFAGQTPSTQLRLALTRYNGSPSYPPLIQGHIVSKRHLKIYG